MRRIRSPREADPKAARDQAPPAEANRKIEIRIWPSPDPGDARANGADAVLQGALRDVANGVEWTFHDMAAMLVLLRQALDSRLGED